MSSAYLAAIFVLATACNAAWIFGIALPEHPAVRFPEPPAVTAGSLAIDRYDSALDQDEIANAEHSSIVDTAAAIEASIIGAIVAIQLARRIT